MKGIVLAGGSGARLYPLTKVTSKQLLPVYDKLMIYYPLSVSMMAGIRDILIISTPENTSHFEELLSDGSQLGLSLSYAVQPSPGGLTQALLLGEGSTGDDRVAMILGGNISAGNGLEKQLLRATRHKQGATVFGYYVGDPKRFDIIEFGKTGRAISIERKPKKLKSNYCVTGLYFYDRRVVEFTKSLKPNTRSKLEITDSNRLCLEESELEMNLLGQGFTWLDTGTHELLVEVTNLVYTIETHQHRKITCLEEIACLSDWISDERLAEAAESMRKNEYGKYLQDAPDGKCPVQ